MKYQTESMISANKSMYIGAGLLRTRIVIIINNIFQREFSAVHRELTGFYRLKFLFYSIYYAVYLTLMAFHIEFYHM
jgi:hypothetical protein